MAWNGSSSAGASVPAPKKPAKKSPGLTHGLIAGGAIVLIGIIALYFVSGDKEEQAADKKGSTKIAEVEPNLSAHIETTVESDKVAEPKKNEPPPQRFGKHVVEVDENGQRWITRNGRRRKLVSVKTGTSKQLFFNMAENQISALVTVKPGDMIVGFDVDDRFVVNFVESLKTKIEFSDDDTPEEREEKELVIEAKKNLKAYMDQGEDIVEIMKEEFKKVAKLNALKTDLMNGIAKLRREGASVEDIDIQVAASNEMLKRYGVDHEFKLLKRERMLLDESDLGIQSKIREEVEE